MAKTLKLFLIGIALVGLSACGGSDSTDGETNGADAGEQTSSAPSGGNPLTGEGNVSRPSGNPLTEGGASAGGGASDAPAEDGSESGSTEVSTATPEAAIESFMSLLADAELDKAADISVQDAPGTQKLRGTAQGWRNAEADGQDMSMIAPMLVGHIPNLTWEKTGEQEDVAYFRVSGPNRDPFEMEVRNVDGQWLVVPPEGGLP